MSRRSAQTSIPSRRPCLRVALGGLVLVLVLGLARPGGATEGPEGYYRYPAIHDETVVFTAEGDLWRVGIEGGTARRLTTHADQETHAAISPDGETLAFSGRREGPMEVYVMPLAGGEPRRLTWDGEWARVVGWTPDGEVLYATNHDTTLPGRRLATIDPESGARRDVPLTGASGGVYADDGTLYFTRFAHPGHFKRYRGGRAQSIWRFAPGDEEATPVVADHPGTDRAPLLWRGRLYFVSDRDGTLNLWSIALDGGGDPRQHTHHVGWDVRRPDLDGGRVVYQLGADLRLLDLESGEDRVLEIALATDFEQRRERWIGEPMDYLTAAHLDPAGERVVLTARGQVFVVPVGQGRRVEAGRAPGVRYRSARFFPEGDDLLVLSDQSGEVELWRLDARGLRPGEQLTASGEVLRFDAVPSPDGGHVAFVDREDELWLLDVASGEETRIETSPLGGFRRFSFSPDGAWLAYEVSAASSWLTRIRLYQIATGDHVDATSDRFDSYDHAWSPDGRFLYFVSDRHLRSLTPSPWGSYAPGPFLDRKGRIFLLALRAGERSPFAPATELDDEEKSPPAVEEPAKKKRGKRRAKPKEAGDASGKPRVVIDRDGLMTRLYEVPVEPGNYGALAVDDKHLYYLAGSTPYADERTLHALEIARDVEEPVTVVDGVTGWELSRDGKKLLFRKKKALYVAPASGKKIAQLGEHRLDLAGWRFPLDPREEWRQMFVDAWRLHRDYFYDPGMHGVDWEAMREKYLPLVERVADRAELSDVFGMMVAELSASHHYVRGGDFRDGETRIEPASLGAVLERDEAAGGYRIERLYRGDPDLPEEQGPLVRADPEIAEGDVIVAIDGTPTLDVADPGALLRDRAGRQVLLEVRAADASSSRQLIVEPITPWQERELRYDVWEHERRRMVDEWSGGKVGYVHLRAMGGRDWSSWVRHYFPVFQRPGLIVDVRHNQGGNIDSWILGFLLRRPWMWWQPRRGQVYSNMQQAYGGHRAVLCDEHTWSDGEAFCEGFRRLGLGPVIGTRTGGGEIWLTSSNVLVDRGIATAAEFGVYGPEGEWLIEGHGVEPDLEVDNLPHATWNGDDAQLRAAVDNLLQKIRDDPPVVPEPPEYPDLSSPDTRPGG